jgi:hypothetical protein
VGPGGRHLPGVLDPRAGHGDVAHLSRHSDVIAEDPDPDRDRVTLSRDALAGAGVLGLRTHPASG